MSKCLWYDDGEERKNCFYRIKNEMFINKVLTK